MSQKDLLSMTSPKSILVATDLHDLGVLLPEAITQASQTRAMVWLLHVVPPEAYASVESGAYPFVPKEKIFRSSETILAEAAMKVRGKNIACSYEVRRSDVVSQITEFIREHKIDRLIIGTSSKGTAEKLLLGSVAEELIRSLNIPICTLGPCFQPRGQSSLREVILATSLRHFSNKSLPFAKDLAARLGADLAILHVIEKPFPNHKLELEARDRIAKMLGSTPRTDQQVSIRIRFGDPSEEIVLGCSSIRPLFLVLGAVPSSESATFRKGVAYKTIARTPCPTFTLRDAFETKGKGNGSDFPVVQVGFSSD